MKVTIEAETKEEREQLEVPQVYVKCFEFVLVGRRVTEIGVEQAFMHRHVGDRYWLMGKLAEAMERLRGGD